MELRLQSPPVPFPPPIPRTYTSTRTHKRIQHSPVSLYIILLFWLFPSSLLRPFYSTCTPCPPLHSYHAQENIKEMRSLESLSFDLLICIGECLEARDLIELSRCCRALQSLGTLDLLWKKLCRKDYGLTYNHPDQTFRDLYAHSFQRLYGRLPCPHLSHHLNDDHGVPAAAVARKNDKWTFSCCRRTESTENMFFCMDATCHHRVCSWSVHCAARWLVV